MSYQPQPGTIPERVIAFLTQRPGEHASAVVAEALGIERESLQGIMKVALQAGHVARTRRNDIWYWRLGDKVPEPPQDDPYPMVHAITPTLSARQDVARWAAWSDGSVVIERGKTRVQLTAIEAAHFIEFVKRMERRL